MPAAFFRIDEMSHHCNPLLLESDHLIMSAFRNVSILLVLVLGGCQHFIWPTNFSFPEMRSQSPENDADFGETDTKLDVPLVGKYTNIAGLNPIVIEGVGLVTGLNNTGGNPPPSIYLSTLMEDMRKRGVRNPHQVLRSPTTALVLVRAFLPPLIKKGNEFDVEVLLPGNSEATSLQGGYLLETFLTERAIVPGQGLMKGHVFAKAKGALLTSVDPDNQESRAGILKRGKLLGSGVSLKERHLSLYLRNDYRSVRMSRRIANAIGQRFHHYDEHGLKEALAEAKTDQKIVLKLHPRYQQNHARYLQVIRNIVLKESPVAKRLRVQQLKDRLHNPATSELAALQLEALGSKAIPILKSGLKNKDLEVRFHAAQALAYLDDSSGVAALGEAAQTEPAFRVFALAGLSIINDTDSREVLRDLMNEKSSETRYGAFRALSTMDLNDRFIRGDNLGGEFQFHVLNTTSDPMVHLTHRRKAEVVLFGSDLRFRAPLLLKAGNHIMVTARDGSDEVIVSRYEVGENDKRKHVSLDVAEVIRAVVEIGGNYPDVAQMLVQADLSNSIEGQIEVDALPQSGRVYLRNGDKDKSIRGGGKARIGRQNMIPNMFDIREESRSTQSEISEPENQKIEESEATRDIVEQALTIENESDAIPVEDNGVVRAADNCSQQEAEENKGFQFRNIFKFKNEKEE